MLQYAVFLTYLFALPVFYKFPAWKCDIPAIARLPCSRPGIFGKSPYCVCPEISLCRFSLPSIALTLLFLEYKRFHHPHIAGSVLPARQVRPVFRFYSPSVCLQISFITRVHRLSVCDSLCCTHLFIIFFQHAVFLLVFLPIIQDAIPLYKLNGLFFIPSTRNRTTGMRFIISYTAKVTGISTANAII